MLRPLSAASKKALSEATSAFAGALPGSPVEEYLAKRGIGRRTAERLKLGYVSRTAPPEGWERFAGRVAIPYINVKGDVVWIKFRSGPETPEGEDKYAQHAGGSTRLYNVQALNSPGDILVLVEGEADTWTGTALGLPTIGIPGANNWQEHFHRCLQGWGRVVMFYDDDKPGRDLVGRVKSKMPDVVPLAAPGGHHDLNEAYVAGLGDSIVALARGEDHEAEEQVEEGVPDQRAAVRPDAGSPTGYNGLGPNPGDPPF